MLAELYVKRRERNLKQSDVAKALNIHTQTYYLKENGKLVFNINEAIKLAEMFDCTLDELFRKVN